MCFALCFRFSRSASGSAALQQQFRHHPHNKRLVITNVATSCPPAKRGVKPRPRECSEEEVKPCHAVGAEQKTSACSEVCRPTAGCVVYRSMGELVEILEAGTVGDVFCVIWAREELTPVT
ncbi:hypothetical protein NDU88_001935 [Pleurodeles waltl]|uniref:Uncharacterized protein n=1 Tax=Pleurodeles waltl TaxID=8319 RepID=A0AAV7SCX7_PLEWA|nr:hypothetical protein NDU88_001935 [Pleurodeles waltl]